MGSPLICGPSVIVPFRVVFAIGVAEAPKTILPEEVEVSLEAAGPDALLDFPPAAVEAPPCEAVAVTAPPEDAAPED